MAYKMEALTPYERVYKKNGEKEQIHQTKPKFNIVLRDVLLLFVGFFLGRSMIMNEISPFGFAFFAYIVAREKKTWIAFSVLPGLIMVQSTFYVIKVVLTFSLMYVFIHKWEKKEAKNWKIAFVSSLSVFLVGMIFQYLGGNYLFDFFLLVFESMITYIFFFILDTSIPLLFGGVRRQVISNEELICGAILISLTLLGMNQFFILGYSIKNILGITTILIFSRYLGSAAGATIGIVVGIVSSFTDVVSPAIIGVYAFAGLLSGIFKDLGKIPVGLGFILGNACLTFYMNGSTKVFISIEEILLALILLIIMPPKIEERIASFQGVEAYRMQREKLYGERVREMTRNRLRDYSMVFEQIGKSFEQVTASSVLSSKNELDQVLDRVSAQVCDKCSFCSKCWGGDFYTTYQQIFLLLNNIEKSSKDQQMELERVFSKKCIHAKEMIQTLSYLFENYRLNEYWKSEVLECRNFVSQQLKGVSDIIEDLSEDIKKEITFQKHKEEEILIAFDQHGIPIKDVMVIEDVRERNQVTVYGDPCDGKNYCYTDMETIISEVLGKKMTIEQHLCTGNGLDHQCKVSFIETIRYNTTTGVVRIAKNSEEISGDSYSSISLKDGKYMVALSDGMGSGTRAAKESRTTIDLLENFFEAGFHREIALKTINSILMLRSNEEMFSTIDLSIIDQYTGKTEFIKIGAVSTFIKRKDKIEVIGSHSLPIGILDEISLEVSTRQLEDGDFVIMVSDGLLDANPAVEDKEKWLMEKLRKIESKNPKKIADQLLQQVKEEIPYGFTDDTTILVTKIWKNKER